ncbi:MAG: PEGA domain-containing protein [Kofleriaceae bacterium]
MVSLLVDGQRQELGAAPVVAMLDPTRAYQVLFERPGYVSVNRPVVFAAGREEETVAVTLERAEPTISRRRWKPPVDKPPVDKPPVDKPPVDKPPVDKPPVDKPPVDKPPVDKPPVDKPTGNGTVFVGAKPPCDIYVDGSALGKKTPSKLTLAAGKHTITLVNNQYGIREKISIDLAAGETLKLSKDFSDKLEP